jgi:hypothetical protein
MNDAATYEVNLWGCEPGTEDLCWTGRDFESLDKARDCFENPTAYFPARELIAGPLWLELVRVEPGDRNGVHPIAQRQLQTIREARDDSDDWRREIAREAGMLGGIDAYNEVMGY